MISTYDKYLGKYVARDKVSVNEAYFKDLTLQALDAIFEELRLKNLDYIRKDYKLNHLAPALIQNLFGFSEVEIIISEGLKPNASTHATEGSYRELKGSSSIPLKRNKMYDKRNDIIVQSERGLRFDHEKIAVKLNVKLNYGLFTFINFTGRMITAILLHEIGHNFTRFFIDERPYLDRKLNLSQKIYDRANETFADQFSTMYGYGKDLQLAQYYMTLAKILDKNHGRLIKNLSDISVELGKWLDNKAVTSEEHPLAYTRMKISLDQLEKDLETVDPQYKDDLKKEIMEFKQKVLYLYDKGPHNKIFRLSGKIDKFNQYQLQSLALTNPRDIDKLIKTLPKKSNTYSKVIIKSPTTGKIVQSYTPIKKKELIHRPDYEHQWDQSRNKDDRKEITVHDDYDENDLFGPLEPTSIRYKKVYTPVFNHYISLNKPNNSISNAITKQIDNQEGKYNIPRYETTT